VSKYYTLDQHSAVPDVLLISTKYWDKLSAREQKWVQEAADESSQAQKQFWNESVEASMKIAIASGVEIIVPDKSLFAERSASVLQEFEKEFPELAKLVDQIKAQ
jgi:TRAP-type C4-dicarboxylate transport system substrate-binding protein